MSETNATVMFSTESVDDRPSMVVTATAIVVSFVVVLGWVGIFQPAGYDGRKYRLPPKSPVGFLETLQSLTGDDILWFFLRLHRRMGTDVCRLNLYVPGCRYVCSVADADLAREILTDTKTTKSRGLIKSTELVTDGVPQFFTSNGPRFHHCHKPGIAARMQPIARRQ